MARPKKQVDPMDSVLKLTSEELMRKRMFDAEIKGLKAQLSLTEVQINQFVTTNPQFRMLLETKDSHMKELSCRMKDLTDLHEEIEDKYNIKLAECTFDEDNGRIQIMGKAKVASADVSVGKKVIKEVPVKKKLRK